MLTNDHPLIYSLYHLLVLRYFREQRLRADLQARLCLTLQKAGVLRNPRWRTLRAADRVAALQLLTFDSFQNAHQSPDTDCWA